MKFEDISRRIQINQFHLLLAAAFIMDLSIGSFTFALTRRAAELRASSWDVGLLASVIFGVYTFSALGLGRLSDLLGRRLVAVCSTLVMAMMTAACALTTNLPVLLVLSGVVGIGLGGFWPTVIAWCGEGAEGAALSKRLSHFSMAWNCGLLVGFGVTGLIFRYSPQLTFYLAGTGIAGVAVLLLVRVPSAPHESLPTLAPAIPVGRGFRKTGWLANFALTFAMCGVIALYPKLATALHISAELHGMLLTLGRGAALLSFWALQHLHFWRTRLWPLWVAQAVVALALFGIGFTNVVWIHAICLAITGAISSYTYQASIYFTLEEVAEKGKGSGLHESILASAMFFGPIMAGAVGERYTLRSPYYFCAVMLALMIIVQMAVVAWRRQTSAAVATPQT